MSQKKPISEQERLRRIRQAEQNAAKSGGAQFVAKDMQRGGFNPSSLVARHQKKTGRGPKGGE